jgi:Enolase C-terminal domain-like
MQRLCVDGGDGDDSSGSPDGRAACAAHGEGGIHGAQIRHRQPSPPAKFDVANHTFNAAELRSMVERVAAVRKAIGPDVDLCIDLHARYDVPSACRIAWEMKPFNLMWLEEPIPAENVDALRQVRFRSRTPICVGRISICAARPFRTSSLSSGMRWRSARSGTAMCSHLTVRARSSKMGTSRRLTNPESGLSSIWRMCASTPRPASAFSNSSHPGKPVGPSLRGG